MNQFEEIKKKIEEFLINGTTVNYILKTNPKLFHEKLGLLFRKEDLNNAENCCYYFTCNPTIIEFIGDPIIHKIDYSDIYEYLFISDIEYNGQICNNDDNGIDIKIEATIRLFTHKFTPKVLKHGELQIIPDILNILDKNAYEIWDRKDKGYKINQLEKQLGINVRH